MNKDDLKPEYMLQDEAAEYLRCSPRTIALFRKRGLLKFCKYGRNFCYKRSWLDEFSETWSNRDLSSESKIGLAINGKKWREDHE